MQNEDIIDVEILPDGTIKSTTPKISAANHAGAHKIFSELARLTGGQTTATKRNKSTHTHNHEHDIAKEGQ